jgi:hypothetical protein
MTFININVNTAPRDFSDAHYRDKCLELTGEKRLHLLRGWCRKHQICQSSYRKLYYCIGDYIKTKGQFKADSHVFCCVNEEILETEMQSAQICDAIGWILLPVDGSFEVHEGNIIKGIIDRFPGGGFVTKFLEQPGVSDEYTAALSFMSPEDFGETSLNYHRDRLERLLEASVSQSICD